MSLPASFLRDGFKPYEGTSLMINTCGTDDSGKTEFILSCPDPGIILALDRNFDATLKNSNPPAARRQDWGFKVVKAPVATQETQDVYKAYWKNFYAEYQKALSNPDAITVALDGDSDSWELQQLAEFGRTTQIAPWDTRRVGLNAARRAMINRAWDAEKVIIFTNKVTAEYETCYKDDGTPMLTPDGREIQKKTGRMKRQGFQSTNYLWQMCLTHIYEPPTEKREKRWGLRIDKCKSDKGLEGMVLWGDDCCFAGLMQTVYPQMPLEHWGL